MCARSWRLFNGALRFSHCDVPRVKPHKLERGTCKAIQAKDRVQITGGVLFWQTYMGKIALESLHGAIPMRLFSFRRGRTYGDTPARMSFSFLFSHAHAYKETRLYGITLEDGGERCADQFFFTFLSNLDHCPEFRCKTYCPYGYKKNVTSGCYSCHCLKDPCKV